MKSVKSVRHAQKKSELLNKEWYSTRSILGNTWAYWKILLGGREAGKSYDVMRFCLKQWKEKGKPFTWLRLNKSSLDKMLANNGDKFIDADLRRKFDIDLTVKAGQLFDHGKPMARALCLSTFYNDKGTALFDNEYKLGYNIVLDEMNKEATAEKNNFDIVYALVNELENLVRSTKENLNIFLIGNTLEEASAIMARGFHFIPQQFGRYYLRSKKAVVDYIPPSAKYLARRKGTVADILAPDASTFTNKIELSTKQIVKNRLTRPQCVLCFSKSKGDWFTIWAGNIITPYNGEQVRRVAMRPYIDELFNAKERDAIFAMYDNEEFFFRDLFGQSSFKSQMALLKPRGGA